MRQVAKHNNNPPPLSEAVFLILLSLAKAPQHGYGLLKDIEALSEGRTRLSTGTLYGALQRLLKDNWIERSVSRDTSRDKQFYRLTAKGGDSLHAELNRMKRLAKVATSHLKTKEA